VPQVPQLLLSVCVSTHAPLQSVCPVAQLLAQEPFEQTCAEVQALPHEPQLAGSLCVLTHWPLHSSWPVAQAQAPL